MHVSVVNSYEAASDCVPVSFVSSVDFPTDGNPINPTRASPDLDTSKPSDEDKRAKHQRFAVLCDIETFASLTATAAA